MTEQATKALKPTRTVSKKLMLIIDPMSRQVYSVECYVLTDEGGGMQPHEAAFQTARLAKPKGIKARVQQMPGTWKVLVIYFDEQQATVDTLPIFELICPAAVKSRPIRGWALVVLYTASDRDLTHNRRVQDIDMGFLSDVEKLIKFI